MTEFSTVTFTGESGTKYKFTAYSRDTTFKKVGAVYFMTKRAEKPKGGYSHTEIYVGETGDLSDRPLNHHQTECFDRHGANCVCIFRESDGDRRLKIEADLRKQYHPPCNLQ